jgi:hypothetical protein
MWCTTFELNPQENIWDEIREKIFKNYAAKSMDEVCEMLVEGSLYIERNPELVKSMTSFPYLQGQFDLELVLVGCQRGALYGDKSDV